MVSRHTVDLQKGCSDHVEVMSGRRNSWELLFLLLAQFMTCPLTLSCHAITPKPHDFFRPLIFSQLVPKWPKPNKPQKKSRKTEFDICTLSSLPCVSQQQISSVSCLAFVHSPSRTTLNINLLFLSSRLNRRL